MFYRAKMQLNSRKIFLTEALCPECPQNNVSGQASNGASIGQITLPLACRLELTTSKVHARSPYTFDTGTVQLRFDCHRSTTMVLFVRYFSKQLHQTFNDKFIARS